MVLIQIASDLHIEEEDYNPEPSIYIKPSSDILILAGDIGSLYKIDQLTTFLKKICKLFKIVLYIPGNHEYYVIKNHKILSIKELNNRLYNIQNNIDNIHILNKSSVRINDLCIVGCTLWSNPQHQIPPFIVKISGMNTILYKNNYEDHLKYINNMIEYCKNKNFKLVIASHYPPTKKVLSNNKRNKFLSLYVNNLDHLLEKNKINTWICGHVHQNFDFISEKGCRIVGNQKGKRKDKIKDYKKDLCIEIN
jgi:predicted phosphohydrolase